MAATTQELEQHYRAVLTERMQDMPFVNPELDVEAIGFRDFDGHQLGVLLTPWFMNLVLLPGTDDWNDSTQGSTCRWTLPEGTYEFNICQDKDLGVYMTALLFRSVTEFEDQETARATALEIMRRLFEKSPDSSATGRTLSRRELFSGLRKS